MTKIMIFYGSDGQRFSIAEGQELERVKRYLQNSKGEEFAVRSRIDCCGAVTHWREDRPDRWCCIYPVDHPELPAAGVER